MSEDIKLSGVRVHNLKNISVSIPKNQIVVFTGVSGSGKSSLVFDTIGLEARRQLIETFSTFERSMLPKITRPDVDEIVNLSPVIVIDQKRPGQTIRSTVGTMTELYTYLRLLYSRCGEPFIGGSNLFSFNNAEGMCPECSGLGQLMVIDENKVFDFSKSVAGGAILHPQYKKGGYYWSSLMKSELFDPHCPVGELSEKGRYNLMHHPQTTILGERFGEKYQAQYEGVLSRLKKTYINKEENSDAYTQFFRYEICPSCHGSRLNEQARSVRVAGRTIPELIYLEMPDLLSWLDTLDHPHAVPIARKMGLIIQYLIDIGVGYLTLHRPVATLSGGEAQRVKIAKQLDCTLVNLVYILDEPSIGLHPRDIRNLTRILTELRDRKNTILVVEHDPEVILSSDHLVDIGPGAGIHGGQITYSGPVSGIHTSGTKTADYLNRRAEMAPVRRQPNGEFRIENAILHNLKTVSVSIPKGVLVCVTGVAGSGKSSLIHGVFCKEHPDAVVIDQSAVGRSSRSNPVTYLGIFDQIRKEFARATGTEPSLFSFNSKGACPKCKGLGILKMDMHFLDDVVMVCDECSGLRYRPDVLALRYKGKTISEILNETVGEAIDFFETPEIRRKLSVLKSVGLDYLRLGQSLSSLSGGEAQRLKLATELHKKGNIYVMDEPTTGLHMADTERLLGIIHGLVDTGNSVIVIEHNLDVICQADYIIDMGPEGGSSGGEVVASGTPEEIMANTESVTGRFLSEIFGTNQVQNCRVKVTYE
ncbi:ATP-binding cassette domain-containing protein [Methanospirillum stamsii]|uniref:Daunorubicin resistance protein DrrC n=1 Tax=Methanospirillum stamsii TaxID=1277351 RepID=A0A2V2N435_9EURY|nr:excinuclease ABC subunit UvrA [Methanospirillum stamsii]PWR73275.1 daunorubicin resistance protein DrrC [Methanospirillum stamsii]